MHSIARLSKRNFCHQYVGILGIDFGATFTKVVFYDLQNNKTTFYHRIPSTFVGTNEKDILNQFLQVTSKFEGYQIKKIIVTGGKSKLLEKLIQDHKLSFQIDKIRHVTELDSVAHFLIHHLDHSQLKSGGLIVSLGTGCPFIFVRKEREQYIYQHCGGTGIGGGTIEGLSRLILGSNSASLEVLAEKGDANKVNTTVHDVIGGDLGFVSGDLTASNFGKIGLTDTQIVDSSYSREDIAIGVYRLVGEAIGVMTSLCLLSARKEDSDIDTVYFVGGSSKVKVLQDILSQILGLYGLKAVFFTDISSEENPQPLPSQNDKEIESWSQAEFAVIEGAIYCTLNKKE